VESLKIDGEIRFKLYEHRSSVVKPGPSGGTGGGGRRR
jgi:hypothetical protein